MIRHGRLVKLEKETPYTLKKRVDLWSSAVFMSMFTHYYNRLWLNDVRSAKFEDGMFFIPLNSHERLKEEYGNYMELPPEESRENRHNIQKIIFSNGEEFDNV